MDSAGLCDICGRLASGFSCRLCGKRICRDCVTVSGACKRCAGDNIEYDKKLVGKVLRDKGLDRTL